MTFALKAGFLSFDATRISTNDVNYPIDVLCYLKNCYQIHEQRYTKAELRDVSTFWSGKLSESVSSLPDDWTRKFSELT